MKLDRKLWLIDDNICYECHEHDRKRADRCKVWQGLHPFGDEKGAFQILDDVPKSCPNIVEHHIKSYNLFDWVENNFNDFLK